MLDDLLDAADALLARDDVDSVAALELKGGVCGTRGVCRTWGAACIDAHNVVSITWISSTFCCMSALWTRSLSSSTFWPFCNALMKVRISSMTTKKCLSTLNTIEPTENDHIPAPRCFCMARGTEDADLGTSTQMAGGMQERFFLAHSVHTFHFLFLPPSCAMHSFSWSFQHGPQNAYKGDEHMGSGGISEYNKPDPLGGDHHHPPVHPEKQSHPRARHQCSPPCAAFAWEVLPAPILVIEQPDAWRTGAVCVV
jgi:hypothetical protein